MTWDRWLYFPSEGRRAEDFSPLKIRWLQPGLNPRTWVLKARRCTVRIHNYPPFEWPWCTTLTKLNVQVIFVTSTMDIRQWHRSHNNKVHDLYTSSYTMRVITRNRTELNIQLWTRKQETQSYSTAYYHILSNPVIQTRNQQIHCLYRGRHSCLSSVNLLQASPQQGHCHGVLK
jgi:hypothetical protein